MKSSKLPYIVPLFVLLAVVMPLCGKRDRQKPQPPPRHMKIIVGGDLMQHLPQVEAARTADGFDYGATFEALKPRFDAADLVIVNLETTLTTSGRHSGYPTFRSPAALADAMRDAGIDVAVLANNHCCDGGRNGAVTTQRELDRTGIRHTGVFIDSASRAPLIVDCRALRVAILNYTYGTNGITPPRGIHVNHIDTAAMAADISAAHRAHADCIAVCIHWGDEYARHPNATQIALAKFMRRHGVGLILGSHPHVIQPLTVDSAGVIVYSLGNMVSNQRRRYCDGGLLVEIEVTKHHDGRMEYRATPVPVWVAMPGYRILPPEIADTMPLPADYRLFRDDTDHLLGMGQ